MTAKPSKKLVDDLRDFIRRYVVMSDEQLLITALWIMHTHCIEAAEQTPYLSVTSPHRQCGKSRLLEIIEMLSKAGWMVILPSEAVLYRKVSSEVPTLLLDEIDTIFNPRTADKYEAIRALLNAGHRRGATVPRCVGPTHAIEEFDVFCPKVLAGIGTLPDTVADRAIPIRLERKTRQDKTASYKQRDVAPLGKALHSRVAKWAAKNADALAAARPALPDQLNDRMQEGCEIVVAIADAVGYGEQAREALVTLCTRERLDDQETLRERLLADVRDVLRKRTDRNISTRLLLKKLHALDEAPWGKQHGHGLEPRELAYHLRPYGIKSTTVRLKSTTAPQGYRIAKGYKRDDFYDAWERYLPPLEKP